MLRISPTNCILMLASVTTRKVTENYTQLRQIALGQKVLAFVIFVPTASLSSYFFHILRYSKLGLSGKKLDNLHDAGGGFCAFLLKPQEYSPSNFINEVMTIR